jgi:hypothetical protein
MFLPLGLQSRIVKWPLASLLIIGITCALGALYFGEISPNVWILKSLFEHRGWMQLIASLILFSLFAVHLEQRIGSAALGVLFLVGGLGANLAHSPFAHGGSLMGISGGVSAVIGAFAVYFWHEKMKLFSAMLPAWMFVAGGFALSLMTCLAPLGHLSGVLIGAIFAVAQMELFPLKKTFLFFQEQTLYYVAKETEDLDLKMLVNFEIYRLNNESYYAFRALFLYICKKGYHFQELKPDYQRFVSKILTGCFNQTVVNAKYKMGQEILSLVPLYWDLAILNLRLSPENIRIHAASFRKEGNLVQTLRLYDLFMGKFAAHPKAQKVQADIMKIFDEIEKFEDAKKKRTLEALTAYADNHRGNYFQTQLKQLIHQVQRQDKNAAS